MSTVFQTREEWLEARNKGIGASEVAAVLGESKWATPLSVWSRKVGLSKPKTETQAMQAGHYLEPAVTRWFEDDTGLTCEDPGEFTIFWHPDAPIFATPDRFIVQPSDTLFEELFATPCPGGKGLLEIKTTSAFNKEAWEDEPPLMYQLQVQAQMAATGCRWAVIVVLIGGNRMEWFYVKRHSELIQQIVPKLAHWWGKHVVNQIEPEVIRGSDIDALNDIHATAEGKTVQFPERMAQLDSELVSAKTSVKNMNSRIKDIEAQIRQFMGDAEYGVMPDGHTYTLKTQHRKSFTVKASTTRVLRRRKAQTR